MESKCCPLTVRRLNGATGKFFFWSIFSGFDHKKKWKRKIVVEGHKFSILKRRPSINTQVTAPFCKLIRGNDRIDGQEEAQVVARSQSLVLGFPPSALFFFLGEKMFERSGGY